MSAFNSADHPRGHPKNKGSFSKKPNGAPEARLAANTPIVLGRFESLDLSDQCDQNNPVQTLNVHRNREDTLVISGTQRVHLDWFAPEGVDKEEWVDRHRPVIDDLLAREYSSRSGFDTEADGMNTIVNFELEHEGPLVMCDPYDLIWENTDAVRLYSESDDGSFGTDNLSRKVRDRIDEVTINNVSRADAEAVDERAINASVELRSGEREISDLTAAAIALRLTNNGNDRRYPALHRLVTRGYAEKEALNDDLRTIYNDRESSPRTKDRVNMMFTYVLNGADNS